MPPCWSPFPDRRISQHDRAGEAPVREQSHGETGSQLPRDEDQDERNKGDRERRRAEQKAQRQHRDASVFKGAEHADVEPPRDRRARIGVQQLPKPRLPEATKAPTTARDPPV